MYYLLPLMRLVVANATAWALGSILFPYLFVSGIIPVTDVPFEEWYVENYRPSSLIVLAFCSFFSIFWFILSLFSSDAQPYVCQRMRVLWCILLSVGPVLAFFFVMYNYGQESIDALPWFALTLFVDIVIGYWLSTALSTPGLLVIAVPGSELFRQILIRR